MVEFEIKDVNRPAVLSAVKIKAYDTYRSNRTKYRSQSSPMLLDYELEA